MTNLSTHHLLNRLRMRQVSLLLALERHGTLQAASSHLGMTQPAATKMIHEIEETLQLELFDRSLRKLRFNTAGNLVISYFKSVEGSLNALSRELKQIKLGLLEKISIGTIMAASPNILSTAICKLKKIYPLLEIEITVETSDKLVSDLRHGRIDLVIGRSLQNESDDFCFEEIGDERLTIVCRTTHELVNCTNLTLRELENYQWILQPKGSPMREILEREFHHAGFQLKIAPIETSSILITTGIITQSDAIAVLPEEVARNYIEHKILSSINLQFRSNLNPFGILTSKNRPITAGSRMLIDLIREENV